MMSAIPSLEIAEVQLGSKEDEEVSGSEEDEDGSGSEEDEDGHGSQKLTLHRPQKKSRKNPAPREIVDELQMVQLVKAYRIEFAVFCRGKKQTPKQMIPNKVWEKIYYNHYKPMFPGSEFKEDTLKKHLREQLAELNTGIGDGGQGPVLQDEVIANEVRGTGCAVTRNILRLRRGFVDAAAAAAAGPSPSVFGPLPTAPDPSPTTIVSAPPQLLLCAPPSQAPPAPAVTVQAPVAQAVAAQAPVAQASAARPSGAQAPPAQATTTTTGSSAESHGPTNVDMLHKQANAVCSVFHRPTKAEMLHKHVDTVCSICHRSTKVYMLQKQVDAVCSIAKNFKDFAGKQALLIDAKRAKHQLALLKEAKEYGVIDEKEFKEKLKELTKF